MENKNIYLLQSENTCKKGDLISLGTLKNSKGDMVVFNDLNIWDGLGEVPNKRKDIYITNDEKPKDGDWITNGLTVLKAIKGTTPTLLWKKIILTTDEDLIKDDVQPIENDFKQWYVKNRDCRYVDVTLLPYDGSKSVSKYFNGEYKIVMQNELTTPLPKTNEDTHRTEYKLVKVTRVEVIDHSKPYEQGGGRVFVKNDCKEVELSYQDDGRTVKIFVK